MGPGSAEFNHKKSPNRVRFQLKFRSVPAKRNIKTKTVLKNNNNNNLSIKRSVLFKPKLLGCFRSVLGRSGRRSPAGRTRRVLLPLRLLRKLWSGLLNRFEDPPTPRPLPPCAPTWARSPLPLGTPGQKKPLEKPPPRSRRVSGRKGGGGFPPYPSHHPPAPPPSHQPNPISQPIRPNSRSLLPQAGRGAWGGVCVCVC